jgi:CBS domain-containing protein
MNCREVMTNDPTCCLPNETAARIAKVMKTANVGSVPICEDRHGKALLGIVTDRDLAIKVVAEGHDPASIRARDVMTRDPVTCHGEDDLQKAMEAMEVNQVRRIPVVDESGHLIGIIAQADIAIRYGEPERIAQVVEEVSRPGNGVV